MTDLMGHTGVYRLYYNGSNKYYIGSTSQSFSRRLKVHLSELRSGRHHNQPLQRGFNKYGESNLIMEPLIVCDKDVVLDLELIAITTLLPDYNASKMCTSRRGVKASKKTRKLISERNSGRRLTEEHKKKISEGLLKSGYRVSDENKQKLRERMTDRKVKDDTRLKLKSANIGKKHTDDTRIKMSLSHSKPKNNTIYSFINNEGCIVYDTIYGLINTYGLGNKMYLVVNGKRSNHKGWRLNATN